MTTDFEIDFASPPDWAALYRSLDIQVVPALMPSTDGQWKRPALASWKDLTKGLVSDEVFQQWYGPKGQHLQRQNVGMLTGVNRLFIVDVDLHKHSEATDWLNGQQAVNNNGGQFQTPTQQTGGGGLQLLFRAPPGWTPPTIKTPIGIDIRGQGGFAMLPPSMHESGKQYAWLPGLEPWEADVMEAPEGLCGSIDNLTRQYGSKAASGALGGSERTSTPEYATTPFGLIVDGREDYMTRLVWKHALEHWRECPIFSPQDAKDAGDQAFVVYLNAVRSRLDEPQTSQADLLEREGRGISLFRQKWQWAMAQWDEPKFREEAKNRPLSETPADSYILPEPPKKEEDTYDSETGEIIEQVTHPALLDDAFEALNIQDIMNLPDPEWLVESMIIERSLGFFYGPPGSGKSFVCLSLALALAAKQPSWFNKAITRTGPVIYVSSEGVSDMKFRLKAWEISTGVPIASIPFYLVHSSMNFMQADHVNRLLRTIQNVATLAGEPPVAIWVDTVSRVLVGADENAAQTVTQFVGACDAIRTHFATTVIGVHHVTKSTGVMRGSSVLEGAADFAFSIDREKGDKVGFLKAQKIKAAQDGFTIAFELQSIPIGDIKGSTSLVAKLATEEAPDPHQWPDRLTCVAILKEIEAAWNSKNPWSNKPQTRADGRYAPAIITAHYAVQKDMAERMVQEWLTNDIIAVTEVDSTSKKRGLKVIGMLD